MVGRRTIACLTALLVLAALAGPVGAQSDEPPSDGPVVHVVARGETLLSIAEQYGTTVEAITHANGISDPRQVYVGQSLVIPDGGGVGGQQTASYVVQAGDSLTGIARRYGTTWQMLVHINGLLSPSTIYPGQVIRVPASVAGSPEPGGLVYVVRSDDIPFRIALQHDVSPWAVAHASHLDNPALVYPGQSLLIPGQAPSFFPAPLAWVDVQPQPVSQGATMVIAVRTTEPVALEGRLFGRLVPFAEGQDAYYGLVGVHAFTDPGLYELDITAVDADGELTSITTEIVVDSGHFGYERIDLPEDRTALLDPNLTTAELELIHSHLVFTPDRDWALPLQRPCVGTISAYFGTHRAYNDGPYTSYHTGVDFRAPVGTPVYAPAAGTVSLAQPLTVRGKTIMIDHGWGVVTGYWHLSTLEVEAGQAVARGDLIGRVGNTGLSTGAHLHWQVWVGGIGVNGLPWLEEFYTWPEPGDVAAGG